MKRSMIATAILALAVVSVASAEDAMTSLSYIAYLERYATLQPANQEDSLEAVINMPVVPGDRIDTARLARVEVHLSDGSTLWLDQYTSVSFDAIALSRDTDGDRTVLFLSEGGLFLEIPSDVPEVKPLRIDGASSTIHFTAAGLYRVEALPDGGLHFEVWNGLAEASSISGAVVMRTGAVAESAAGNVTSIDAGLTQGDEFARWVDERRRVFPSDSSRFVDESYGRQATLLDNYGSWVYSDSRDSYVWQPSVTQDWRPYTSGRWYWTSTGWTWISYEPWGWLPYHYGSWNLDVSLGWVWSWGPVWGPAWVNWMWWPGYVAWCPSGYYDSWYWNHPGGHHPHPPGGGHGGPQPPRGGVVPPRLTSSRLSPATVRDPADPSRFALDLHGQVPLDQVDPRAWNAVPTRDFASPNLSRYVEPGERALRSRPGERGVVLSGPLVTDNPARQPPSNAVERVFQREMPTATNDLAPILARDPNLDPRRAAQLGRPTTTRDLAERSPVAPAPRPATRRSASAGGSPSTEARSQPNIYRSTLAPTVRRSPTGWRPSDSGSSTSPRRAPSDLPRARPTYRTSPDGRVSPGSVIRPAPSTAPRTTGGSTPTWRVPTTGGSRPVIVPRSSSSGGSRSPTVRSPSSGRVAPSGGSRVSPSRPSAAPRSSGGSVRPSGGSARPSGGSAARTRRH